MVDVFSKTGAVYRAADLTTGFKVKRFLIKDVNMYPVDVSLPYQFGFCDQQSMHISEFKISRGSLDKKL